MQASLIHPGEVYAWYQSPPKGHIPLGAKQVRVIQVRKTKDAWSTNSRTLVDIVLVETNREISVPAREIIDFWDSYERETKHIREELAEKERQRERRRYHKDVLQAMVEQRLAEKGLLATGQLQLVPYADPYTGRISLPLELILPWLEIGEVDVEAAIDRLMEHEESQKSA